MYSEDNQNDSGNKDRYFKGQQKNEELICFFRHHWIDLTKEFMYFALFLGVIVFSLVNIGEIQEWIRGNRELKLFFLTGFILSTAYMHHFFIKVHNYFVNIGIITDIRIIDHQKTLYFVDNMDTIDMSQIQSIERIEKGFFPNVLRYGDIKIYLNASAAVKIFHRVPNAKFHYRCINRQKEAIQSLMYMRRRTGELPIPIGASSNIFPQMQDGQPNPGPIPQTENVEAL